MRIGLLSSWPWDPARGSGTARFLLDLERALAREGADVTRINADLDPADYAAFVDGRIAWNRGLSLDPRLKDLDVLFALDLDGFELPPPPAGPPKVVCPQAVFADLAATEPEPYRGFLLRQAEAESRNVHSAAALIAPSRYAAEGIARAYRADRSKVRVIPHGFDVEEWQMMVEAARGERESGPGGLTILSVAKLYPRKGIDTLLESLALLRHDRPAICLRIVGDGIEGPRLRALAARLGIEGSVSFEGDIADRRSVAAFYAGADLFCLPSRHETFGFVFLEAMAAGLPIVAADAGAAREVMGDCALLVRPGDPSALVAALERVIAETALRSALQQAGLRWVRRYDWQETARRYLEAAQAII